jgi:K+-transporting ATPase A subunit
MDIYSALQHMAFIVVLTICVKPIGGYLERVFSGKRTVFDSAIAMIFGRFALAIPALALAGLFARQKNTPPSAGTLRTDSAAFGMALTATVLIVAGPSYFPALTLGPILEQLMSR